MSLRIIGKEKVLKDLERAEALIREASSILHRTPIEIQLQIGSDTECEKISDSDSDSQ